MAKKKTAAQKKAAKKLEKSFEESLWDTATKLSEHGVAGFCKKIIYRAIGKPEEIIKAFPDRTEVAA